MFKIGIEAHTIEKQEKLGAGGNYLLNLLKEWSKLSPDEYQFILYFKDRIPEEEFLNAPVFKKKIAKIPGISSTMLYYNILMPLRAALDRVDILFLPFYMRPFFCFSRIITTVHDIFFKPHPEWCSWRYRYPYLILTKLAVKTSEKIIASSEYTKKEILKYYHIPESKIQVVHLAADDNFNNKKDEEKIKKVKEKYGLKNKYLFYAGTIFNRRHVLESILAFGNLLEKYPNYQFLISGRDHTRPAQNINREIEKINLAFPESIKRIKYIDNDDMKYIYQGTELLVWISEYEGFGLPVLEAMASKTPVLTTRMTSLNEIIGDYPIAVDNPNDINEIKEKMEQMLFNEHLRKTAIEKGLFQAQKFSWQKTAEQTLKIIENEIKSN